MFFDVLLKRSIQNPLVPLTSARILDYMGGPPSSAGVSVNSSTILTYSPVWSCIDMIAPDVAKLPLEVYRRTSDVGREKDPSHEAYFCLARQSNERMAAFKFWRRLMVHALIYQRAFAWITRVRKQVRLYHLLPDRTMFDEKHGIYVSWLDGKPVGFYPSEVLEIEGFAGDDSADCSLVRKARDSIGVALATQNFKGGFFAHGAHPSGYLQIPPHFTREAADNLAEGFLRRHVGHGNQFRVAILRDGATFNAATINARDSQLAEIGEEQVRDVARWFKMPPSKLGIRDSVSYNSEVEANRNYLNQTLSPWLVAIRTECWLKLLSEEQRRDDTHIIEHNVRAFLAANPKDQAEIGKTEIEMGAITVNEYRAATNRNPVAGGDRRIMPLNFMQIDEDGNVIKESEPAENPNVDAMAAQTIVHAIKRVAVKVQREASRKDPQRFCSWWDDNKTALIEKLEQETECARAVCGIELPDIVAEVEAELNSAAGNLASRIADRCFIWWSTVGGSNDN